MGGRAAATACSKRQASIAPGSAWRRRRDRAWTVVPGKGVEEAADALAAALVATGGDLAAQGLRVVALLTGDTRLAVVHTHVLALGMLFFLIVLALEKQFALTSSGLFGWFYWIYNARLAVTVGMRALHGTLTVLGHPDNEVVALVAGAGHILLAAGLVLLFVALGKRLPAPRAAGDESAQAHPSAAARPTAA